MLLLIGFVFVFLNIPATFGQTPAGNKVYGSFTHSNQYSTNEDNADNIPLTWSHHWFTNVENTLDGGSPVKNPVIKLQTNLNLVRFSIDDPLVFTAYPESGLYIWDFKGLQIEEPAHLPLSMWESEETLIEKPKFSISRRVEPEILTEADTFQTITVVFKLEEPLPPEVNTFTIGIGSPLIAYQGYRLVEGYFVSQVPVAGWDNYSPDGLSAEWAIAPANIELGRTYQFQATLKSVKSPDLVGSPIFKPDVLLHRARQQNPQFVTANSVTITDPNNIISATFIVDNVVDWTTSFEDFRFDFWVNRSVSEVTSPTPPFHVLIDADVDIKPETLNLKSKGVLTAFIKLPEQYNVKNITVSTITCNGASVIKGIVDDNTLIVKFRRQDLQLQKIEPEEKIELTVTGQLSDGTMFEGSDKVRTAAYIKKITPGVEFRCPDQRINLKFPKGR